MNTAKAFLELYELNREWFEANKHLTNKEMLDAGLIDKCDLVWINKLREGKINIVAGDIFDAVAKTGIMGEQNEISVV